MTMRTSNILRLLLIAFLQVARCAGPCDINVSKVLCTSRSLFSVPALPPYITHLYLELNYITEINNTSFSGLEDLEDLDIGSQRIGPLVIRNDAFHRQRHLARLVLSGNLGLKLEPRVFAGLFNLKHLFAGFCSLEDSILEDNYLQPLLSLETLDLQDNQLRRLRPARFFSGFTHLKELDVKHNKIQGLCEGDLSSFQGKFFLYLTVESNSYQKLYPHDFNWTRCGNPFRGISFGMLDVSFNGFNVDATRQFFNAIKGTKINHLIFKSQIIGKGFSFNNIPDPDNQTFVGLKDSSVGIIDLSKNTIFSLQKDVFSPLREAIIIDVSQNKINKIDGNAFSGLQGNLLMLNLSHNLLGEVRSTIFENLSVLRVLDLSYNHIGVLGYMSFKGLPDLRMLDLTGNSLREMLSLAPLQSLDYLLLEGNNLPNLQGLEGFASNCIELNLSNNRLTNLGDVYKILKNFKRLQRLFYAGNFIQWCTPNNQISVPRWNRLEKLDLDRSSLQTVWAQGTCLDLFDHLGNVTSLSLRLNSIQSLPRGIFRGLTTVRTMDLSFNSLTHLQPGVFPQSLITLDLSNNFLASPNPLTFSSLTSLSSIDLSMNGFHCDCNLAGFVSWINRTNVTFASPTENFKCDFPSDLYGVSVLEYSHTMEECEEDDEGAVQSLRLALFITCSALLILIIAGTIAYTRFRGHIFIIYKKVVGTVLEGAQAAAPPDERAYDAYICFSNNDYQWVEGALLKKLDSQFAENNILRCCFEARDFLPGEDHLSNVRDAVWGSKKTMCIVTKEFLKDGWCLEAFKLAQGRMLEELTDVLIMVVVGKVPHYRLMKFESIRNFVQKKEYIVWPEDEQDMAWFYEKLVSKVLKGGQKKTAHKDAQADPVIQQENNNGIELQDVQIVEA